MPVQIAEFCAVSNRDSVTIPMEGFRIKSPWFAFLLHQGYHSLPEKAAGYVRLSCYTKLLNASEPPPTMGSFSGSYQMITGLFGRLRVNTRRMVLRCRPFIDAGPEPWIWTAALIWLGCTDPGSSHFTLCPLANLGVPWCPGCGLGHAVGYALRGELARSLHEHLLGIPAVFVLTARVASQFINSWRYPQHHSLTINQKKVAHG
jgi:hypothetical protein